METLGMTNDELTRCKKKTATATVRCIIRHLYPNPKPEFGYAQLDPSIIQKVIGKHNFVNLIQ
jgi:hypothetical protein